MHDVLNGSKSAFCAVAGRLAGSKLDAAAQR
jgi:hypothetical protein